LSRLTPSHPLHTGRRHAGASENQVVQLRPCHGRDCLQLRSLLRSSESAACRCQRTEQNSPSISGSRCRRGTTGRGTSDRPRSTTPGEQGSASPSPANSPA
jgi:hypothetical protein